MVEEKDVNYVKGVVVKLESYVSWFVRFVGVFDMLIKKFDIFFDGWFVVVDVGYGVDMVD